ncbi:rhodanese-like domain-containing protein [Bacteroidetes/Chlorobi group bacterium Naka2016]|jgi:rhodanese-related sulfurtransferase|nr:MAG: rhodanese-like domain-containing protein [Bacteroidetes/Chlorobi group bacterium Naka2016]
MKNINWKQILNETLFIIAFAVVISIIYNTLNPNGINLLKKPKVVSDTLLEKLLTPKETFDSNSNDTISPEMTTEAVTSSKQKTDSTTPQPNSKELAAKVFKEENNNSQFIEVPTITLQQLLKYLDSPKLLLIDARSEEDYTKEHIGKAINIFAFEEDLNQYFQKLASIPFDDSKVIVVYCEGGTCDASHKVATDLIRLGHKNVFVFAGGWEEWSKQKK